MAEIRSNATTTITVVTPDGREFEFDNMSLTNLEVEPPDSSIRFLPPAQFLAKAGQRTFKFTAEYTERQTAKATLILKLWLKLSKWIDRKLKVSFMDRIA